VAITSLSEFLLKKAASYEAESRKNQDIIDEWLDALRHLFDDLKAWLSKSDPNQILEVREIAIEVNEPNVGRYAAPRLDVRAFGVWVGIIPKARKTVRDARPPQAGAPARATGRVDITNEVRRYVLYRMTVEGADSWYIENQTSNELELLTQERFEQALMSYFQ